MSSSDHESPAYAGHGSYEHEQDSVAIIGIGCRFPGGVDSPESFWELLSNGQDALIDIPEDRWQADKFYDADLSAGVSRVRRGGFLTGPVDQFDAGFFGISPREADHIDPQQRLLLEVAWEAIEDSGLPLERLAGTAAGVFVGGFTLDYSHLQFAGTDQSQSTVSGHTATGVVMTMLANRISHAFDLLGPSLSVDTACSSSLVATHLACRSLRSRESSVALAGGVNLMLSPNFTIAASQGGFLSPTSQSRAFDAAANGYVRGEGAGIVVLKRLPDAMRDGDRIYAVIRGTAVTQDGRTKGITVPNGHSQRTAMRNALADAEVTPASISYVEAHGTGTPVGDPIEANAIGAVYRSGDDGQQACLIGSVKTNIGHLEAAAGVAGLIKTTLCLFHREVPAHLHLTDVNPAIDLDRLHLAIPAAPRPIGDPGAPVRAAVNSFGFGGTNAHAVLESGPLAVPTAAPATATATATEQHAPLPGAPDGQGGHMPLIFPLTARSQGALADLASRYAGLLEAGADPAALAAAVTRHRSSHRQARLAVVASGPAELGAALRSAGQGDRHPAVRMSQQPATDVPLAFVYTGMGPQWWGMARGLLSSDAVFRAELERCDAIFAPMAGWSLIDAMLADETTSAMTRTEVSQPANFAVQVGLTAVWKSLGITPDAIIGHSAGEIAAAYAAGALSFDDAVTVIYHRARLQQRTSGQGRLLAVAIAEDEAVSLDAVRAGRLAIAAVNSPSAVALVGRIGDLEEVMAEFDRREVFCRLVDGDVPFHSPAMDAIEPELRACLAGLSPLAPAMPLYSTVTGGAISGPAHDAGYWWRNVRDTVRFADAARAMIDDGITAAVEVGPHPVLGHAFGECLRDRGRTGFTVPSLHRKHGDGTIIARSIADLFLAGRSPEWSSVLPASTAEGLNGLRLPAYPWQRERFWSETDRSRRDRLGRLEHSLLGARQDGPAPAWRRRLDNSRPGYLADHQVMGANVLPGACYVEMALAAGRAQFAASRASVEEIRFATPVVLRPGAAYVLETTVEPGTGAVRVFGRGPDSDEWTQHASARLAPAPVSAPAIDLAGALERCGQRLDRDACYAAFQEAGFDYGPALRSLSQVWIGDRETVGRFANEAGTRTPDLILDPVILDGCFQLLLPLAGQRAGGSAVLMPSGADQVVVHARPEGELWAHATIGSEPGSAGARREITGDVLLADADGRVIAEVRGFRVRVLDPAGMTAPRLGSRWLHEVQWVPLALAGGPEADPEPEPGPEPQTAAGQGTWLILGHRGDLADRLASALAMAGQQVALAYPGDRFRVAGTGRYEVRPTAQEDLDRLLKAVTGDGPPRGIVHLLSCPPAGGDTARRGLDAEALERAAHAGPMSLLGLIQVLDAQGITCPVSVVTAGAQPVDGHLATAAGLSGSPLWGLGRVLRHESLTLAARLMDLDPARPLDDLPALAAELLLADGGEDQVAWRAGARYVARLNPAENPPDGLPARLRPDASYLITGGLGALGLLTARWLAERGARRIILLGRRAMPPRPDWPALTDDSLRAVAEAIQDIEGLGATVETAGIDVADPAALSGFLADRHAAGLPPVRGVIHSAGVVRDQVLTRVDRAHLDPVVAPKILGGWALHEATAGWPLDFFILYSSVSSVIATAGQGSYAAGNAFLDALAHYRRDLGLPALSVNWGPWDSGMIAELGLQALYARRGLDLISAEVGLRILGQLIGSTRTQQVVASAHWPTLIASYPIVPRMIEHLGATEEAAGDGAGGLADLAQRLADAPPDQQPTIVEDACAAIVGAVLRMPADEVPRGEPLNQIGLDSMIAVELRIRLEQALGAAPKLAFLLQDATVGTTAEAILAVRRDHQEADDDGLSELADLLAELGPEAASELLAAAEGAGAGEHVMERPGA
ncbi:MAG: type I polyketide synthase [Actinomycetota bacterium]|nr:type I polyketide synthase [Actinomycetota bacterium]